MKPKRKLGFISSAGEPGTTDGDGRTDFCSFLGIQQQPQEQRYPFVNDALASSSNASSWFGDNNTPMMPSWFQTQNNHAPNKEVNASDMTAGYKQSPASLPPPIKDVSPEEADSLLAKDLNRMSLQERERIFDEIHGVVERGDNDEIEVSEESINRLEQELLKIDQKHAYLQAKLQNPSYTSDKSFLMKFLHAEDGDPKEAAHRLVTYFEHKLELFKSADRLTKEITIMDFMEHPDDKRALESGVFHTLDRDRSGRRVILKIVKRDWADIPTDSKMRVFWYMMMTAVENEEDMKRGVVLLVVNMDGFSDRLDVWRNCILVTGLPVRVNAVHMCLTYPTVSPLIALCKIVLTPYYRCRVKVHNGTIIECIYSLHSYGIASSSLPINCHDTLDVSRHHQWIEHRQTIENQRHNSQLTRVEKVKEQVAVSKSNQQQGKRLKKSSSFEYDDSPTERDVLFGRGKGCQNHPGNVQFRNLIDSNRSNYEQATLIEKTMISERVVQDVKARNGRFLKSAGKGKWDEVSDDVARDKISHTFRDQRRKLKQQQRSEK